MKEVIELLEEVSKNIEATFPNFAYMKRKIDQALSLLKEQPVCEKCRGSKVVRNKITRPIECSKCDGWGWLSKDSDREYQESCPECGLKPCPACQPIKARIKELEAKDGPEIHKTP